jgi:hypothetical protein
MTRHATQFFGAVFALTLGAAAAIVTPVNGQAPGAKPAPTAKPAPRWVMPRTPDGKPDLQGNWTNETQTPLERMTQGGSTLTDEQAQKIEDRALLVEEHRDKASDPNRPAPPKGGEAGRLAAPGERSFIEQIAEAAGGGVGGYNGFWLDPGLKVIRIDGVARSSIIIDPPNGRIPGLTDLGKKRTAEIAARSRKFGEFDHPEMRPLADRCLLSFGSNAGPPMLPNYFYNNNYQIVQTRDHVMILVEMVHDARIIRIGGAPAPKHLRSWMGDSIGRWEGDTLVVDVTNLDETTWLSDNGLFHSDKTRVVERLRREGDILHYDVTVEDPVVLAEPWKQRARDLKLMKDYEIEEAPYCSERDKSHLQDLSHHGNLR